MPVTYAFEPDLSAADFQSVLKACSLGARRPVDDLARLDEMLRKADIIATARRDGKLVGVARALSDFSYACYLSDLAVDEICQREGIGKCLIEEVRAKIGPRVTLILIAAPEAESYYPHIGMQQRPSCWLYPRSE